MLRLLLAKDLRRAWRNPIPLLINIALPLCITALISIAFGEKKQDMSLGRIRLAIVDEDDSILTGALRSAVTRRAALEHLEPVFVDRPAAMRLINSGKIAGVLIVPTNFQRQYFSGKEAVSVELIKNPAQSIHPTVLEEAAGAVVTALDAVARNFPWRGEHEKVDYHRAAAMVEEIGRRFDKTNKLSLSFVSYEKEDLKPGNAGPPSARTPASNVVASPSSASPSSASPAVKAAPPAGRAELPPAAAKKVGPDLGIFGYILIGMSAMFLLFIASNTMTDLQRELRFRTFERYHTVRRSLLPFIMGKAVFALVVLLLCSGIMLGLGALAFGIRWSHPLELGLLTVGYAFFGAGLMALLVAIIPSERRSSTLNDLISMFLALAGGCMFPVRQLPSVLRDHISPLLPTYWFVETARDLQSHAQAIAWSGPFLKLLVLGMFLLLVATFIYQRRFSHGLRG